MCGELPLVPFSWELQWLWNTRWNWQNSRTTKLLKGSSLKTSTCVLSTSWTRIPLWHWKQKAIQWKSPCSSGGKDELFSVSWLLVSNAILLLICCSLATFDPTHLKAEEVTQNKLYSRQQKTREESKTGSFSYQGLSRKKNSFSDYRTHMPAGKKGNQRVVFFSSRRDWREGRGHSCHSIVVFVLLPLTPIVNGI
jgi:hypothetical protein